MLRGGRYVACMSGRTIPDAGDHGSSNDAEQASAAVSITQAVLPSCLSNLRFRHGFFQLARERSVVSG